MRLAYWPGLLFIAMAFLAPSAAHAAVLGKPGNNLGLVGYWPFNEGAGTIAGDFSGSRNNGTLSGSTLPAWTAGKYGGALSFDGSTSYIPVSRTVSDDFTLSAWIKTTQNAAGCAGQWYCGQGIVDGEVGGVTSDFGMSVYNGKLAFGVGASDITVFSNASVNTGQWVLVTATRVKSTGAMKVYVNGALDNTGTGGLQSLTAPTVLYIGADANINPSASFFSGSIDDVRVYNRALSDAEIVNLYRSGSAQLQGSSAALSSDGSLSRGLIGLWTFDGPDMADKVYDRSGRGNNGYFNVGTATSSTKASGQLGQSIKLNGSSNVISIPGPIPNSTTALSVSEWIKTTYTGSGAESAAIYRSSGLAVFELWLTNGKMTFYLYGGSTSYRATASNVNDGLWHHIVGVYDGTSNNIYVDGALQNGTLTGTVAASIHSATTPLFIGAYENGTTPAGFFPGSIDDFRIYNRALSATEVAALYRQGAAQLQTSSANLGADGGLNNGLVGLWTFDGRDLSATTAYDRSASGYNGTLSGSPAPGIGRLGQGLNLSGSSYITLPATGSYLTKGNLGFASSDNFAISAWYKGTDTAQNGEWGKGLLSWNSGGLYAGLVLRSGYAEYIHYDGAWEHNIKSSTIVADGAWHHVVYVNSGGLGYLYIDGANQINGLSSAISSGGTYFQPYHIGANYNNVYTSGAVDDVRLYSRALSAAEVKQLYRLGQ